MTGAATGRGTQPNVLAGTRILVTAQRRASDLALALARRGAEVDVAATLGADAKVDVEALVERTRTLLAHPPEVVVVTTGVGFRGWWEAAEAAGLVDELHAMLDGVRLVARGPKANGALQTVDLRPDWVAQSETSAEIGEFLRAEGVAGVRVAVQQHGAGDDGLTETLTAAGADVVGLVVYRWGPPPDPDAVVRSVADVAAGLYDAVAFTSAPGAQAWLDVARRGDAWQAVRDLEASGRVRFAAVGAVTAEPLRHAGLTALVPERGRLGALVRTLVVSLGEEFGGVATTAGRLRMRATTATLDHRVLPLSPSGVSLLRRLCLAPGAVVSRADLLAALPGDSVDPHTAEVAVARAREAIGTAGLIRTVVKRGYRLDVDPHSPAEVRA